MKRILVFFLLSVSPCFGQWSGGVAPVDTSDPVYTGVTAIDSLAILMKVHGTCGSTETFNRTDGGFHTATLDANLTASISNMTTVGYNNSMTIRFVQDATGGWTITWPAEVVSAPQINPAPNAVTFIRIETSDSQTTIYARSDFATGILPQSKSANYTLVMGDANTEILHPASDNNARVFTIPANSSVAFPIGTNVTFTNMAATSCTIAITTDTATLIGAGSTGTRTLAQYGQCCYHKISATAWTAVGTNLTYWLSPELEWLLAA